jgi:hypothetical protein
VAPGLIGWQSRVDERRFAHQFDGTEYRLAVKNLFAALGLTVSFPSLVKQ